MTLIPAIYIGGAHAIESGQTGKVKSMFEKTR